MRGRRPVGHRRMGRRFKRQKVIISCAENCVTTPATRSLAVATPWCTAWRDGISQPSKHVRIRHLQGFSGVRRRRNCKRSIAFTFHPGALARLLWHLHAPTERRFTEILHHGICRCRSHRSCRDQGALDRILLPSVSASRSHCNHCSHRESSSRHIHKHHYILLHRRPSWAIARGVSRVCLRRAALVSILARTWQRFKHSSTTQSMRFHGSL